MRYLTFALLLPTLLPAAAASSQSASTVTETSVTETAFQAKAQADYGKLPLSFEVNRGQAPADVEYLARGNGYSLMLTGSEAVLALGRAGNCKANAKASSVGTTRTKQCADRQPDLVHMSLSGSGKSTGVRGEEPLETRVNYIRGNDPTQWLTDLPTYARVRYPGVYPGVDLVYYGNQQQLEYDFVVAPGASAAPIRLTLRSQKRLHIAANGDLILDAAHGTAAFHRPVAYQEKDGRHEAVTGDFQLAGNRTVTFRLGSYDHSRPLVIDPVLVFSTYLGGGGEVDADGNAYFNLSSSVTADAAGHAYIAGATWAADFPVSSNAYQQNKKSAATSSGFITKLNTAGTGVLFSTYLGGTGGDAIRGIALDSAYNIYLTGRTDSSDFPTTTGAIQTTKHSPGGSPFIAKLSENGSSLLYSTYLNGSGASSYNFPDGSGDGGTAIAVDALGNAYVTGSTTAPDFPVTSGVFQPKHGSDGSNDYDDTAFVAEINPTGKALVFSTYLGGSSRDIGNSIALDGTGNVYVGGEAQSTDFPTTAKAYQPIARSYSYFTKGFVTKLSPGGTSLIFSTYLSGSGADYIGGQINESDSVNAIAVDSAGSVYAAGETASGDFPVTVGAYEADPAGSYKGFVAKLNSMGTALIYSTLLNGNIPHQSLYQLGNQATKIYGLGIDASGNAYVTGKTTVLRFPITAAAVLATNTGVIAGNPYYNLEQALYVSGIGSAFVTEFDPTGRKVLYSTFLGGSADSLGSAIAVTAPGTVYVTGTTNASDFPVTSSEVATSPGQDLPGTFVSRLILPPALNTAALTSLSFTSNTAFQAAGFPITFTVKVTVPGSNVVPTGSVQLFEDGTSFQTLPLDATGTAVAKILMPDEGAADHTVVANYLGTPDFSFSGGSLKETLSLTRVEAFSGAGQRITYGMTFPAPLVALWGSNAGGISGQDLVFSGTGLMFSPASGVSGSDGKLQTIATPTQSGNLVAQATAVPGGASANFYLTVYPAVLTIMPTTVDSTYGQAPPAPTAYTLTGFVNGDTSSVVSGMPMLSANITATTPAGFYPILSAKGTLNAVSYKFDSALHPGGMRVNKAPLTLKANNITITRGSPLPSLTYTLTGFVNGDTAATAFRGTPTITTTAGSTSAPRTYPINVAPGTLTSANYLIAYVPGTLTILP